MFSMFNSGLLGYFATTLIGIHVLYFAMKRIAPICFSALRTNNNNVRIIMKVFPQNLKGSFTLLDLDNMDIQRYVLQENIFK